MRKEHGGFAIANSWYVRQTGDELSSDLVDTGSRLGIGEDTVVLLGGNLDKCCFSDLTVPALKQSEEEKAIRFALQKCSPMPVDKLQFAWRRLDSRHVRVFFVEKDEWVHWLGIAGTFGLGIDRIVPACIASDPTCGDTSVALEVRGQTVVLAPCNENGRTITFNTQGAFNIEGMDSLPDEGRSLIVSTIPLALYGLSPSFNRDRNTLPTIPDELRPKRHIAAKLFASVAIAFFIVSLLWLGSREWKRYRVERSQISAERRVLQSAMNDQEKLLSKVRRAVQLKEDLMVPKQAGEFSLTAILAQLSERLDQRMWVSKCSWRGAKQILLEIESKEKVDDLATQLEQIEEFAKVTLQQRSSRNQFVSYTITIELESDK